MSVPWGRPAALERCEHSLPVDSLTAYHEWHLQVAAALAAEGDLTAKLQQAQQEVQEMAAQHAKLKQELSQAKALSEELGRQLEMASSGWTQDKGKRAQLQQELDAAQAALAEGGGELSQVRPILCTLQHACGDLLGTT